MDIRLNGYEDNKKNKAGIIYQDNFSEKNIWHSYFIHEQTAFKYTVAKFTVKLKPQPHE